MTNFDHSNIDIDPKFDSKFYQLQYPETEQYDLGGYVPNDQRLYHHYLNYGKHLQYCINLHELKKQLNLNIEPPRSFDPVIYKNLYLPNEPYFDEYSKTIDIKYLMYHHYINYGKEFGHSCNHDILIFFHMPKCGGTSLHYGTVLPSLYKQYCCRKNYIYNIDWISNDNRNLFTTVSYSDNDLTTSALNIVKTESENTEQVPKYLKRMTAVLDSGNLDVLTNYSHLLCIIFNAAGFKEHKEYTQNLIPLNKQYNKYIILREPIDLQISIFYYLRDVGSWELTYGKIDKNMSFSEYIRHPNNYINNWLIRQMAKVTDEEEVKNHHAEICKKELDTFTKIGFLSNFENFIQYLYEKYNWSSYNPSSQINLNQNNISKKEQLSNDDILILKQKLYYDEQIYNYFVS